MNDLTIIYITANQLPKKFAEYQIKILKKAVGGYPIISVCRDLAFSLGETLIDDGEKSTDNIYRQMLRAAKIATTPYVAIAEDDCFYHENHFNFYRPPQDTFCYDQNRFALFTWGEPIYSWRDRVSNCSLIAPRGLLIETLEERFEKYPDPIPDNLVGEVGRERVEKNLGLTLRKSERKYAEVSIIQFNHENGSEDRQKRHRKNLGQIKALDLFYWGNAKELIKLYED